ncbi:MAG: O-antigen ligase family protein [Erythrobacter sp.]|nr:O-antigen ligase family protein [Erythrobacter sp.]
MRLTRLVDFGLWALLLLTVLRTTLLVRRRDTAEFDAVDNSATIAIALIVGIVVLLMVHPRARGALVRLQTSSAFYLLLYLALAALSAFWSVIPEFTLFRAGEVIAVFGALFVLMEGFDNWRNAERAMLGVLMVVTVLAFFQRVTTGGVSMEGLHTNVYTVTAGMGFLYTLAESLRADPRRKMMMRRWMVAFLLFAVVGTSAGSNIGIAVAMLILLPFLSQSKVVLIPAGLACVALAVVMGASEQVVSTTLLSGRSIEEAETLTGRMFLWQGYWNAFLDSPLIGHGFAIVARIGDQFGGLATTNAHNGFIEAGAGLGLLGFGLLCYYCYRLVLETIAATRARIIGGLGCLVAVVMMLVNNNSKSLLGGAYDPTMLGVFALLAFFHSYTLRATREQAAQRRAERAQSPEASARPTPARP